MIGAPRLLWRLWHASARGVLLTSGLWLAGAVSACDVPAGEATAMPDSVVRFAASEGPVAAWYDAPTNRYPHGVLGDTIEAGALVVLAAEGATCRLLRIDLPESGVFEDLAPRLVDLDADGRADIIAIHSANGLGARLAIYGVPRGAGSLELMAATPYIGRTNRWLAPIGSAADFNGDGYMDVAYIDRPHLARILRVWTFADGALQEIATAPGLTNHRIGEDFITGGIRDCGAGPEMVTADIDWRFVMVTRFDEADLVSAPVAAFSKSAVTDTLACQ